MDDPTPEYVTARQWVARTGMSLSMTYRLLRDGDLTAIKLGRATKLDFAAGLRWLRSRPAARFKPPLPARRSRDRERAGGAEGAGRLQADRPDLAP